MRRIAFFLGGLSYPNDQNVERAIGQMLAGEGWDFVTQYEIDARTMPTSAQDDVTARLDALGGVIDALAAGRDIVLVGRSTGARVATLLAARRPIAATICLAYPFRSPNLVLEPERFAHLATQTSRTLILQGSQDRYGGLDVTETYLLSPAIELRFFQGDHEFELAAPDCAHLPALMRAFLDGQDLPAPVDFAFDEDFYRALYPDIDAAIIAGRLDSGEAHYRCHGRAEGRRCRMRECG